MIKHILLTGFAVCLILINHTAAEGTEWVSYGESSYGDRYYYDKESIIYSRGTVKVWAKSIFSEQAKQEIIKLSKEAGLDTEKYDDISYSLDLFVIKCRAREFRINSLAYRNSEGETIDSYSNSSPPRTSEPIPPGSTIESLYKKICKRKGKK